MAYPPRAALALCLALLPAAIACDSSSTDQTTILAPTAIFAPDSGELPLPNDLLFVDSIDGTLVGPDADTEGEQALSDALSALDGWSLSNPVRFAFSTPLDPATVTLGDSVRMYEVELDTFGALAGGPVNSILRELGGDELAVALHGDGDELLIWPQTPLAPATSYLAVVTRDVRTAGGAAVLPSIIYDLALDEDQLDPSSELFELQERLAAERVALEAFGGPGDKILISTSFTTQSIGAVHAALKAIAEGQEEQFAADLCSLELSLLCADDASGPAPPSELTVVGEVEIPLPDGVPFFLADFFEGTLALPTFSEPAAGGTDPSGLSEDESPLSMRWSSRFPFGPDDFDRHLTGRNPLPASTGTQVVPLLLSRPITPKPENGYPLIVFQHGITGDRANLLALVNAFGLPGFAMVAMDLPLHGIVDDEDPLFAGFAAVEGQLRERTFGLDLLTENDEGEEYPGQDGVPDSSGAHFIQLESFLTTRDNLRQAASDLLHLIQRAPEIDFDGDGVADIDPDRIHYVGHSLGAIVGGQMLPYTDDIVSATLAMPGGGLARLLNGSPTFGPRIVEGLAEQGVFPGTDDYETFLDIAQAAADDGDALSHARALTEHGTPIHMIEVVGEEGVSDPDQVVPNFVVGAPLAGTDPYVATLGLTKITANLVDLDGIRGVARFLRGDHVTVLIPNDFDDFEVVAAWEEMQRQVVDFAFNEGKAVTILDETLLEQD